MAKSGRNAKIGRRVWKKTPTSLLKKNSLRAAANQKKVPDHLIQHPKLRANPTIKVIPIQLIPILKALTPMPQA